MEFELQLLAWPFCFMQFLCWNLELNVFVWYGGKGFVVGLDLNANI